jgi:hypothetical protein
MDIFVGAFFVVIVLCSLVFAGTFLGSTRPKIRKAIEARGCTLESVRLGWHGWRVIYRTKLGERRAVSCAAFLFGPVFFADDDRPVPLEFTQGRPKKRTKS